jgi:formate hydrogenlyase subunit 6/NADH:ubiquinone oxidoreductase subunit I
MDFDYFVEGPFLWIAFLMFIAAITIRLAFFFAAIIRSGKNRDVRWWYNFAIFGRFFIPFHKAVSGKPFYTILRYIFHICLIVVPVWFGGHISLWEESRFEWTWSSLPDEWIDWMTLLVLGLATYFLVRRIISKDLRINSSVIDYCVIVITALPFLTGYFLIHATLDSIAFFSNNMWNIHILSGGAMILMAAFLFCSTRMNTRKCTGCAACEISCPTGTLESSDETKQRIFTYSHYQCICCGACVNTCPEQAAELRHEISLRKFFQIISRYEIKSVELAVCERCGELFAPVPQLDKVGQTFTHEYLRFCPRCRMVNIGDLLYQLSPWHRKEHKTGI